MPAPGWQNRFNYMNFWGRNWQHECVQFPLTPAQLQQAKAGQALAGQDGNAVTYQVVPNAAGTAALAFHVDLPPFAAQVYDFTTAKTAIKTDLIVEETADTIRIANAQTGIVIRKRLADGNGPVARMRLQSGKWVGGSRLTDAVTGYTATLTARGPVFAEIVCTATWDEQSTWTIRFRLNAGEPVVLVDEQSAVAGKGATFQLDLQQDFAPE